MSERRERLQKAADAWVDVWADETPRRVDALCPACGCIATRYVLPPLLVRLAAGYEPDPAPIVEGVVIECRACILHGPDRAPG